jgi:cobalt-zinc-cadmium efflux system membrane fusion protein
MIAISHTARAALLATSILSVACSPTPSATAEAAATPASFSVTPDQRKRFTVTPAAITTFRPTLEVTGSVAFDGDHSTQVIAAISGPVTRLVVNPGARVKAGDVLATVSSPDFAVAVATYRKALEAERNAKRIQARNEQLFANDALARNDLDQSRADAVSATADVDAAAQGLTAIGVEGAVIAAIRDGKQTSPVEGAIRSPIAGVVVEKLINPGQLLQAGSTAAFTVADLRSMWVLANVYERDLALVTAGETVEILTDAHPGPIAGRVDYVSAMVDAGTKATTVRIVAQNPGETLKRDMFVRVQVRAKTARQGILVPDAAVLRDDQNLPFVFVAKTDGTFERHRVTLGAHVWTRYEITTGVKVGDPVVANGALFIQFAESQ